MTMAEAVSTVTRPWQKMNFQFLRTADGIINFLQVLLGIGALFSCCFIWSNNNAYVQFIYGGYGWQTLIDFLLFVTWLFAAAIFLANLTGKSIYQEVGKQKMLIAYGICTLALIVAAGLESWYANLATEKKHDIYPPRFIVTTIFSWLLVISYMVLIAITIIFL